MSVGFVLITTEPGSEISVRNALDSIDGVSGRWVVFGSHDLLVKVEADDESKITKIVIGDIRAIEGITDTRTLIGAEI
ncbi:MAG TPA: Lrp/AsnC family transcriptional regulator [Candidatus Thalassarchaeaceae archaeon]|jgi:DNA-binding Lrp family transcriptional regulator|nr:AsnC family transcriptional regulator [Euryarchaeota archaeon]MBJ09152.1 AsnC family transcriptional regulator [Euryarchaeota archaeon]MED5268204.1 Lrp/AsnC ligand binding domain-containing protein [Candidatus Thermoplasmatota archaeon]DAC45433.1 MAG TPA: Lrp/AsnC family transcriptional regulator [Candidatus Poseidoniales archaeon]HII89401.1 Lrp/AsnC family transcriptional regulator [Candidatus Thalassarchaeaceae archaeon]|tara:strand:- start:2554 stop:2787 length:234 start_codon:yes stop_codon:yes gene_type:complete